MIVPRDSNLAADSGHFSKSDQMDMLCFGIDTWYANEASAFSVAPSIIPNSKLPGQANIFGGAANLYPNVTFLDLPAHVSVEEGQKAG